MGKTQPERKIQHIHLGTSLGLLHSRDLHDLKGISYGKPVLGSRIRRQGDGQVSQEASGSSQ